MNRSTRTLIVVTTAVGLAGAASYGVYRAVQRIPVREVPVSHYSVVVARRALPVGTLIVKEDVKLVPWPSSDKLPGGFEKIEQVVDRGLVVSVLENEPLAESKLAPAEAGAGLPPTIPAGMRAISVKVNEVIGVAGFTVPGTRVDVLAMVRGNGGDSMSRIVVSNVMVLTSGTKFDQDEARKDGKPIKTTVVTLAVMPADAERIALAATDGHIILALRNPLDQQAAPTSGVRMATLMVGSNPPPAPTRPAEPRKVVQPAPVVVPVVQAPRIYTVEAIRASKRSEETIR